MSDILNEEVRKIKTKDKYGFDDFKKIMEILISDNGCPWDKIQTHETLKPYLIEECYEVIDAVNKKNSESLCEELGDVLLQVMFHSIIGEKNGEFSLDDVIDGVSKKMIYRHPNIFSDTKAQTAEDVVTNWEKLKQKEKGYKNPTEALKSIPDCLPALIRAQKVIKKASDSMKDDSSVGKAIEKLKDAVNRITVENIQKPDNKDELIGEILLIAVNISEILKINSEFALTNAVEKFINKFEYNALR